MSIIVPWIYHALKQGFTVLAIDVKGNDDLLSAVRQYAKHCGPLNIPSFKWDYTDAANSFSWNWIRDAITPGEINSAIDAICGMPSPNDPNQFFHDCATRYLRSLLELSAVIPHSLSAQDLFVLVNDQEKMIPLVHAYQGHRASAALLELTRLDPTDYANRVAVLVNHLTPLIATEFLSVTTNDSQNITIDWLWSTDPKLTIVTAPLADGKLATSASALFLGQFLQNVKARLGTGSANRPVLLVLDEAPRLQDRIDLGAILSTVAQANVSVLLALQDVSQLSDTVRDEILSNCATKICLPRVSEATTRYFTSQLGEIYLDSKSVNTGDSSRTVRSSSWTHTTELRPVLSHREIAHPPTRFGNWTGTVHSPDLSHAPIVTDLTRTDLL